MGCGGSVPLPGRQSSGNLRTGARGGHGCRIAGGGERLGWLPLHSERWGGGFRVPTLALAGAQQGEELALQHDHGLLAYQDYVGAVAQHVAVDTEAAAAAISRLAEDPALRLRMGEAGRQTVRNRFDWPVVARLHHQLYSELAERRCAAKECSGLEGQHPLRGDPFRDFAHSPRPALALKLQLRLAMPLPELQQRLSKLTRLDRCYGQLHASPADLQRLLVQLQGEWSPVLVSDAFADRLAR